MGMHMGQLISEKWQWHSMREARSRRRASGPTRVFFWLCQYYIDLHCIEILIKYSHRVENSPIRNSSIGLFVRHRASCGMKMPLQPSRIVVMITIYLAQFREKKTKICLVFLLS